MEEFEAKLAAAAGAWPEPDLPGIKDGIARERAQSEWEKVKKVYTPEQLLAGVQILKGAMREAGAEKRFLFARNGYLGWILAYVAEQRPTP